MNENKKKNHNHGVSLLELIFIMAVVNILVAFLFTGIHFSRKRARLAKCINNIRTVSQSILMYALDNDYFPTSIIALNPTAELDTHDFWDVSPLAYADVGDILAYYPVGLDQLQCPEDNSRVGGISSYGLNFRLSKKNYSKIQDSSKYILLSETENISVIKSINEIEFRHSNQTLASYADGHVDRIKLNELIDIPRGGFGLVGTMTEHEASYVPEYIPPGYTSGKISKSISK